MIGTATVTVRGPTRRLGMLVPSSNTVAEPETVKLLPRDGSVVLHVSRLRVVQVSDQPNSLAQFDQGGFLAAADLLADARVDHILWNGTAASWLGFEHDRRLTAAIKAHTGIAACTAVTAINDALVHLGVRRLGLVTPYVSSLEARIIDNYAAFGMPVTACARLDLTINTDFAAVETEVIARLVRQVAAGGVDAIVIMCTNLAGASVAPALSRELGVPVLDSVRVAVDFALRQLE